MYGCLKVILWIDQGLEVGALHPMTGTGSEVPLMWCLMYVYSESSMLGRWLSIWGVVPLCQREEHIHKISINIAPSQPELLGQALCFWYGRAVLALLNAISWQEKYDMQQEFITWKSDGWNSLTQSRIGRRDKDRKQYCLGSKPLTDRLEYA